MVAIRAAAPARAGREAKIRAAPLAYPDDLRHIRRSFAVSASFDGPVAPGDDLAPLKHATSRPTALSMDTQTTTDHGKAGFWRFSVAPMMDGLTQTKNP